jgi:membrane protein implicated in regulation of membrane protease activity
MNMPAGAMTTVSVLAYCVPAGIMLALGTAAGAVPDGIPGDLFQFGALGLVAFMVWNKERSSMKTARVLDQRHAESLRLTQQVIEALERNTRAMEACVSKQQRGRVET